MSDRVILGMDSTNPQNSSVKLKKTSVRVHSVCFHDKICLECIWSYAADLI